MVVRYADRTIVAVDNPPSNCHLTVPHPGAGAKKGEAVKVTYSCLKDGKPTATGVVTGRVAPELGSIRASVCPAGTNTDENVDPPTTPTTNTVVTFAQRRTEELRRAQVRVGVTE